jgi:transposase
MLERLMRHHEGESVWSVVRVPSKEVEDERRRERERERLTKDRTALRNQIFNVLATCGVPRPKQPPQDVERLVDYFEHPLAEGAKRQLQRLLQRLTLVE